MFVFNLLAHTFSFYALCWLEHKHSDYNQEWHLQCGKIDKFQLISCGKLQGNHQSASMGLSSSVMLKLCGKHRATHDGVPTFT